MAGISAGVALHHLGVDVAIYERAGDELASRGAGIATHDGLYEALTGAGVHLRDEMGIRSMGRLMLDSHGAEVERVDVPQVMTSWGLMYRFLRAQIPDHCYHNNYVLCDLVQDADRIVARFQNGEEATADWLIGADGTRSTVRRLVAPEVAINYCGSFGWRGLIDENLIAAPVLGELAHRMTLCLATGGHWLGYLVAGLNDDLRPGHRLYNWGWYRTADEAKLKDHQTDATGLYHEQGIPHSLIRPELVAAMQAEARAFLGPQPQTVVGATHQPFIQGMFDLGCEHLVYDRVCLVGDAAITARPHIGLGVSKAIEDATSLAIALAAQNPGAALAQWEKSRLRYGLAALAFSRDLGSYIGPTPVTPEHRAKAEYHQRPEIFLNANAPIDPQRWLKL